MHHERTTESGQGAVAKAEAIDNADGELIGFELSHFIPPSLVIAVRDGLDRGLEERPGE